MRRKRLAQRSRRFKLRAAVLAVLIAFGGGITIAQAVSPPPETSLACYTADGRIEAARQATDRSKLVCAHPTDVVKSHQVQPEVGPAPTGTTTGTVTSSTLKPPVTNTTIGPSGPGELRFTAFLTAYDFADNNPPNSGQISHPVIHKTAGGSGTAQDPLTVAVDHLAGGQDQFPPGTRFYVPNVRAYLIAEDTTGETAPARTHLDMWADGQTSSESSAFDCMSHVTGNYLVIQNPAATYAVVPGSLSANNQCRQLFGDTVVTSGGGSSSTTVPAAVTTTTKAPSSGGGGVCPTAKPASTYAGAKLTVTQTMQAAYDAGFHTVGQLQAMVGIGTAESSLTTQARNWHPEYGCRPASDVIGVQGPTSAWNAAHTQQMNSDRGVWQISSHSGPQYSDAVTDDPAGAAKAAFVISGSGTNFGPWDTFKNGGAQSHYPSAATVNAFLAAQ